MPAKEPTKFERRLLSIESFIDAHFFALYAWVISIAGIACAASIAVAIIKSGG